MRHITTQRPPSLAFNTHTHTYKHTHTHKRTHRQSCDPANETHMDLWSPWVSLTFICPNTHSHLTFPGKQSLLCVFVKECKRKTENEKYLCVCTHDWTKQYESTSANLCHAWLASPHYKILLKWLPNMPAIWKHKEGGRQGNNIDFKVCVFLFNFYLLGIF